jgi:hypothetical protein
VALRQFSPASMVCADRHILLNTTPPSAFGKCGEHLCSSSLNGLG